MSRAPTWVVPGLLVFDLLLDIVVSKSGGGTKVGGFESRADLNVFIILIFLPPTSEGYLIIFLLSNFPEIFELLGTFWTIFCVFVAKIVSGGKYTSAILGCRLAFKEKFQVLNSHKDCYQNELPRSNYTKDHSLRDITFIFQPKRLNFYQPKEISCLQFQRERKYASISVFIN